jgi:hypothetical protein
LPAVRDPFARVLAEGCRSTPRRPRRPPRRSSEFAGPVPVRHRRCGDPARRETQRSPPRCPTPDHRLGLCRRRQPRRCCSSRLRSLPEPARGGGRGLVAFLGAASAHQRAGGQGGGTGKPTVVQNR